MTSPREFSRLAASPLFPHFTDAHLILSVLVKLYLGANYTCIKLHGATVRTEVLRLAGKYDDVVIDVDG